MSDLVSIRRMIQVEESRFKFAVSESMIQKIGSSINFINTTAHEQKQFFVNGKYNISGTPQLFVDGMEFFQFGSEIIDVWMYLLTAGGGGTTELDIKYATTPGGSFNSIFSTTPKISQSAGSFIWINIGSSLPNTVAPILGTTTFAAGTGLKLDIITAQSGDVGGCGIVIHYRPISL